MNFSLPNEKHTTLHLIVLIIIAYTFSLGMRLIWIHWASGIPEFTWNNQLMINTNDGYYFAASAQNALTQIYNNNPRIDNEWATATVSITVLLSKIFPIETIILYLPIFVASLVVIPIILIGKLFNAPYFGFFSALFASIGWSYYNRTMAGYYDTDMFSAMAPMIIVYFLMATTIKENTVWALLSALSILLYPFLYDQGLSIVYAISLFYMGYMLFFHRREKFTYFSIALLSIALFAVPAAIKLLLIMLLTLTYHYDKLNFKTLNIFAGIAFLFFLVNADALLLIWGKISGYTIKGTENGTLHFYAVAQTVREAGQIPFSEIANRISGSMPTLLIAFIGYMALITRHRAFILTLPLIGIGLFSFWGGLRFTIYAVPVAALGSIYFLYLLSTLFISKKIKYALISIGTMLMLYPNIIHILGYQVPTVLTAKEVASLQNLQKIASSDDYTIAWWDYGYPLWFYTHTNTLIDGGKHDHDNFIVAEILTTSSQIEAARLSRIATETYVTSNYKEIADTLFIPKSGSPLNVSDYLDTLKIDSLFTIPQKTRDVYLYLPLRMMEILPTVALFSNLDLNTPDERQQPLFYSSSSIQDTGKIIELGNSISILKDKSLLKLGDQEIPIKSFYQVGYNATNTLQINEQSLNSKGLNIIYLASYGKILILDDFYLNSMYIQMFVFEHYDKNLFEPVTLDPMTKIYKLKI
jgi:dolichyl-diphosphooligosaccharide--protein glycosyltransferase/undecaprenyl-diphosphooligosaccharide--protein glycosyltransferase